jgi:hypothetical protein
MEMKMKQREREIAIARDVTDQLLADVRSTSTPPTLATFAHCFGAACKAHGFVPDEPSYNRIMRDVVRDIGERQRAADRLNTAIVQSTADLLEIQRKAGHTIP